MKARLRGRAWRIDKEGYVHLPHPSKQGFTLCRRPTKRMQKSWDGSLFTDCQACQDLIRLHVKGKVVTPGLGTI